MKILYHGKFFSKTIEFFCECCECTFQADFGEYSVRKEPNYKVAKTKCPECGSNVEHYIYR